MSSMKSLTLLENFVRNKKIQYRYFIGMGVLIASIQYGPEISVLMGYNNVLHAEIDIIPVTNEIKNEFERLCKVANIDPDSIVLTTWSRENYKLIGSSLLYKIFGLKSILCIPALYESSYTDRRSRGYSRLTIGRIKWHSPIGSIAEVYYVPNILEKSFGLSGQLAIHKYDLWLLGSTFCIATFISLLYIFSMYIIEKKLYLFLIPIPLLASLFVHGPLWSIYLRLETYLSDTFVIRNFPELAIHGKSALLNKLFFHKVVKLPGNKTKFMEKYYYDEVSLANPSKISRIKRLDKCIKNYSSSIST